MSLGTASEWGRLAVCSGSGALPRVERITGDADRGTAVHAFLEAIPKVGRDEALAQVPDEYRARCEVIDVEALPLDSTAWAAEVALSYDVATGRADVLGQGLGRAYPPLRESEIAGTADVIGLSSDGERVVVLDYKSGRRVVAPYQSWQLRVLALAACGAYGRSAATVGLVYVGEDGAARYEWATYDSLDLATFADELRERADRVLVARRAVAEGEQPALTTSGHCTYCPCYTSCPAQVGLIRAVVETPAEFEEATIRALTPAQAREAYHAIRRIETLAARLKEQIRTYATAAPIVLGDGQVYGPHLTVKTVVNARVAYKVLEGAHGAETANAACDFTTSKTAIEKAVGEAARKRGEKMAPAKRDALAAIKAAGGLREEKAVRLEEHRAEDPASAGEEAA